MQEASLTDIRTAALAHHTSGRGWHFHILSPTCVLNNTHKYAFVFESTDSEVLVHYSEAPEKELGAELSPLLHKSETITAQINTYSADQKRIIAAAKHLNELGMEWHHHLLFPDCRFNSQPEEFCLMLEDSEKSEVHKAKSTAEPHQALAELEPLYYQK